MRFFTNCLCIQNKIYLREIVDGNRNKRKLNYQPTLFLPANEESKWKTLDGKDVKPMQFSSIKDSREFISQYKDVENFEIYGNTNYHYCFMGDEYPGKIEYNFDDLIVCNLDIEVASENGFPTADLAQEEVIAITMKVKDLFFVFGCGNYKNYNPKVTYFQCEDEVELLSRFLDIWEKISPDIITGWYIEDFDIPYLVNRITKLLGNQEVSRLSPWKWVKEKRYFYQGKEKILYNLVGISCLDYLTLYKNKSLNPKGANKENYKLNTIAHLELGEKKLSYEEYGNLYNLYKNNYQKFIDYNIKDVELVDRLENKLKFIELVVGVAYDAKVNFDDVLYQVRTWDTIIYNHLKDRNIVIPQKERHVKKQQYAGGYVKEPQCGMHDWVMSFDLNSLYPHLIAQFNVSPETIRPEMFKVVNVEGLLKGSFDLSDLKNKKVTMAANGHHFDTTKEGFLPKILMEMYSLRTVYKNKMLNAEKKLENINTEMRKRKLEVNE